MEKYYVIQDREAGNVIEMFDTFEQAEIALRYYEAQDILDDIFVPNFYEIKEINKQ